MEVRDKLIMDIDNLVRSILKQARGIVKKRTEKNFERIFRGEKTNK